MTTQIAIFASQLQLDPYSGLSESADFLGDILARFDQDAKQKLGQELLDFASVDDDDFILENSAAWGATSSGLLAISCALF